MLDRSDRAPAGSPGGISPQREYPLLPLSELLGEDEVHSAERHSLWLADGFLEVLDVVADPCAHSRSRFERLHRLLAREFAFPHIEIPRLVNRRENRAPAADVVRVLFGRVRDGRHNRRYVVNGTSR